MPSQTAERQRRVIRFGASRSITVEPGSMVLVRQTGQPHARNGEGAYGAVIAKIAGCSAWLTFTPVGCPRVVPLGMILCSVDPGPAMLDPSSVPRHQPKPQRVPQRRRRAAADV